MIWLLLLFFFIICWGVRFTSYNPGYMGRNSTTCLKGLFAVLILFSHMRGYLSLITFGDQTYNNIISSIGQLMVAPYFFYSGYGIIESYNKKTSYVSTFPKNRILKTLIHFDLAVLLFFIYSLVFNQTYPLRNYILCWTGWESIGNSNWFVFDILMLYVLTHIAMNFDKVRGAKKISVIVSLLTIIMWVLLYMSHRGGWWYSTLLCFPLGMLYSYTKNDIDQFLKKNGWNYFLSLAALMLIFLACRAFRNSLTISIEACVFCLMLTLFTMKISIGNKILYWLGINAFSIYILQRLPMTFFAEFGLNENNMIYAVIVIPIVIIIAWGFTKFTDRIDLIFFNNKQ